MGTADYLAGIPNHVKDAMSLHGINTEGIISFLYTDMDKEGNFADCWIFFDKEFIYVMSGYDKVSKKIGAKKLKSTFDFLSLERFETENIKKLEVERFVSTARLIAVHDDETTEEIIRFSLGIANKTEGLIHHYGDFKENKPITHKKSDEDEQFCPKCGQRYPDPSRKICPKCMDKGSIFRRLLGFFKFYWKKLIAFFAMMLISTGFSVISPYIGTKLLYDNVLTKGVDDNLYGEVGLVLLVIIAARVLSLLIGMGQNYVSAGIVPWVVYDLKVKIFTAMQKLSVSFYTSKQTGSLMTRVNRDANNIYWFFVDGVPFLITNVITFIGVFAIMIMMNWKLSIIVIVMIPVLLVTYKIIGSIFRWLHHIRWVNESNMSSFISDSMSGQRIIKAFAKEKDESERFAGYSGRSANSDMRLSNMESTVFPLIGLVMTTVSLVVLFAGGISILNGTSGMTLGKLMTFTAYMNMLYSPLDFLSWISDWWARCLDSAQRIFEVIDAVPDVKESENPVRMPEMKGDIEMKDVAFEYEPGHPIIKNLSLSVKAGHMVGIVGKTGAGKSTIVNLMARLYDVGDGEITIDGVNVKDIAMCDMRRNIGIVSQEIYLFIGTIADNIRYAKPDATMEEVINAAKTASAHEFIMRLPDGYETRIGAGGQDLSGGEKQRLSIARTVIQNPKILILDEATASMDTETERHIQESLQNLQKGRTTIAIAHRLSTLRDADVLAVIENGEMKEYGTHEELIKKKGEYYKLYMLQFDAIKHIGISE